MRTLFVNRLYPTNDAQALYDWFVKNGHKPEDVMMLMRHRSKTTNWALVRFPTSDDATAALRDMNGQRYNHPTHSVLIDFSTRELQPPTDPRWHGRWLNWQANRVTAEPAFKEHPGRVKAIDESQRRRRDYNTMEWKP